jgi:thiol-disulfide isomerase/thioredoxin
MKNKLFPLFLFIIAFSGFLSMQILWDTFNLSAKQVEQENEKHAAFEAVFQELKLTTTKSTTIELKNEKAPIVLLNFWASWCHPCLKEFPSLVKFQERYKEQVRVIGINGDDDKALEKIRKTEEKYALNFESVDDSTGKITDLFGINTYPVSIVYHRGKVIYVNKRIHDFMDGEFLKLIDSKLKAD